MDMTAARDSQKDSFYDNNDTKTSNMTEKCQSSDNLKRGQGASNIAMIVPRGFKIRDEFICPITRELITDPVIAADGHTYDRAAIEQWIHRSFSGARGSAEGNPSLRVSPRTGQPLEHLHLIPNHNLKRLLKDMISEGGESLYYRESSFANAKGTNEKKNSTSRNASPSIRRIDSISYDSIYTHEQTGEGDVKSDQNVVLSENSIEHENMQMSLPSDCSGPRIALVHAKVLHCKCLGPPESDWNNRAFHLKESIQEGCTETLLGGRRRPHEHTAQNFVQFTDATVSRRHFEIRSHNGGFQLRDLGSAGGTFVRIPPRCGVPLKQGTMIMLGKHQLIALSCTPNSSQETASEKQSNECSYIDDNNLLGKVKRRPSDYTALLHTPNSRPDQQFTGFDLLEDFSARNEDLVGGDNNEELSQNTHDSNSQIRFNEEGNGNNSDEKVVLQHQIIPADAVERQNTVETFPNTTRTPSPTSHSAILQNFTRDFTRNFSALDLLANDSNNAHSIPLLILRCFAPEGTPIQNRNYPILKEGTTLGRKQSNNISFSHPVQKNPTLKNKDFSDIQQHSYVGIDSSISGEHATIKYNEETKQLELFDGVNDRLSTNGTWIRLSPMHEESDWITIDDKTEILIGTVRFQAVIEEIVVEKDLYD